MTDTAYFDIPGAATYSTLSSSYIGKLVASGKLPSSKVGRCRVIARKDIDAFLAKRRQVGTRVGR